MSLLLRRARFIIVLPAAALMIAGCSESRVAALNTTSSADAQASSAPARSAPSYQTGYGVPSGGYTTDLATELFGSRTRDDQAAAAATPQGPVQPGQPALAAQQGPSAPKADPGYTTAYGLSSNGPTTDVYTELFGPKRNN